MKLLLTFLTLLAATLPAFGADSLPRLTTTPQSVEKLWADYDPRTEPLDIQVVREWKEDGFVLRYVVYSIGTFKGKPARMAAFYGFPQGGQHLPALMHMHGGGQRAFLNEVKRFAKRGYAVLSVNWGGRPMENAEADDPNTNWGAVDPTQNNVAGYSNLLPKKDTIDPFPSARNNNWFLLAVGCRRGITFLERQKEVNAERIGVFGHSMGGRLTGLVAGSDERVKVASPSVGGSGFLQTDLWGLRGSARQVNGDVDLFQRMIAGQAYLPRIHCPILFLSATNDFNAPMDFVEQGMQLVPHENKGTVYAPHLNHRFTPETEIARPLWFDAHLQKRLDFPQTPSADLTLQRDGGIPLFRVKPDASRPIERVDIYYGYERDPRNRFWADAQAIEMDGVWQAECPVFDLDEPLFAFANVYYRLTDRERREGDPATFAISVYRAAYPEALRDANVKATEQTRLVIDDFARGFHDWYTLNADNRHHWFFSTRKLADPRWEAPRGAKLAFEIEPTEAGNTLAVELTTDSWRGYSGRRPDSWTAIVRLDGAGRQRSELATTAFTNAAGQTLDDWFGITELAFQSGAKSEHPAANHLTPWRGDVPKLSDLRWTAGELVRRRKPYLPSNQPADTDTGLSSSEFQRAIDDAIRREQIEGDKTEFVVAGYLPDYRLSTWSRDIGPVTDLMFFGASVTKEGRFDTGATRRQHLDMMRTVKAQAKCRLLLTVGGWEKSAGFATLAADRGLRKQFIHEARRFCIEQGFDGIDYDWEHPDGDEQIQMLGELLQETDTEFGRHGLIVTLAQAGWQNLGRAAYEAVDRVHLMAYDHDFPQATFDKTVQDVKRLLNAGCPRHKIVLGLPFYGRDQQREAKTYAELVQNRKLADDVTMVDGFAFNGAALIRQKVDYARQQRLAGVMIWELGQDSQGPASLLRAISDELTP